MYGLLIENLASFIKIQWGESKWDSVRKHAGVDAPSFSIHHVYAETLLARLARSACHILDVEEKEFFEAMGVYFVEFVGVYGYDSMLQILGRHLRDFLFGLDNLHEYLKFSYTKMRAPAFYCDNETATGLRLHYRSKRRGFVWYTIGQIKQIAKHFYNEEVEIELVSESLDGETMHNIFQLKFDNQAFVEHENLKTLMKQENQLPIRASIIFELFPFCIVFSTEMVITYIGHALLTILKDLVGQCMTEAFEILRPLIPFSFDTILERSFNIFELITTSPIQDEDMDKIMEDEEVEGVFLKLRGQMLFMEEWNMILFLGNPVLPDVKSLVDAGIFINDLSLHDCSRDLVLAGTQQSVELKLALDQEQHKSKKLEESMKKLDEEMKRTDELLYQMIPKQVADRLRSGERSEVCEVFDMVSILFSDVVTFTDICSKITPIQVVQMLNHMYGLFDQLTERNGVYKVETIGDSYMVVAGCPEQSANHAERIADMAMDMVDASKAIADPTREGEHLKLRVGCHSGMVVAGVVGVKMPRYCLFGDTVNTSSRMESSSQANRIQISETCMQLLPKSYQHELRGTVPIKGKGDMNTYWLLGRESRVELSKATVASIDWSVPGVVEDKKRRGSKVSDKGGSRKSSVIPTDAADAVKSRDEPPPPKAPEKKLPPTPAPMPAKKVDPQPSTSKAAEEPPKPRPPPPQIVETLADGTKKTTPAPVQAQGSTEDSQGNKLDLNDAGKNLYSSARRLSNAIARSRSPSPAGRERSSSKSQPVENKNAADNANNNTANANNAGKDVPSPTPAPSPAPAPAAQATPDRSRSTETKTSPTSVTAEKKPALVKQEQVTAEAEQPKPSAETPKPATVPANANEAQKGTEDVISTAPVTNDNKSTPGDAANNNEGVTDTGEDRESFLINVKMKAGQENGGQNGFKRTINGIAVGISRLPKNEALRKKIRENKIAVVTADVLTDMGCVAFADKQKQVISQACSIL